MEWIFRVLNSREIIDGVIVAVEKGSREKGDESSKTGVQDVRCQSWSCVEIGIVGD